MQSSHKTMLIQIRSSCTIQASFIVKNTEIVWSALSLTGLILEKKAKSNLTLTFPDWCWKSEAQIKVRDNTASDNHCFSQSAIKIPRTPNQAWLQSYSKWFIISKLQPLISYYSDKLHLMITEEMKVGFMTLKSTAKNECFKSFKKFILVHLTITGEIKVWFMTLS